MKRILLAALLIPFTILAGVVDKAQNKEPLNTTASYEAGVLPGPDDIVRWPLVPEFNGEVPVGGDLAIGGVVVTNGTGSTRYNDQNHGISGSAILTLGADGIYYGGKKNFTVSPPISLAADQSWFSAGGGNLGINNTTALNGFALTLDGNNNKQFKGRISGTGTIIVERGQAKWSSGTAAPEADVILHNAGYVNFDNSASSVSRFASATFDSQDGTGPSIRTDSAKSVNEVDRLGALHLHRGQGWLYINANSSGNAIFEIDTLDRQPGGCLYVRGSKLGQSPMADNAAGYAAVRFVHVPTLLGGNGVRGETNQPILPFVIATTNTDENAQSFATYDDVYGLHALDFGTEFAHALPLGQTTDLNVRLDSSLSGAADEIVLPSGITTVNSLFLNADGANGAGGITLRSNAAGAVLRLASGALFVRAWMASPTAADAITLSDSVTLDLGGHEGFLVQRQRQESYMRSNGPLILYSPIVNDGGQGVTFTSVNGGSLIYLYGNPASTYTGPTRLINGRLRLLKNGTENCVIPGDLEIWAGTCQNTGNTLPDTSDIRVYGGSLLQKKDASNSGSGTSETFHDLEVYDGSVTLGASGTSSGRTTLNEARLHGGTLNQTRGHSVHAVRYVFDGGTNIVNRCEKSSNRTLQYFSEGILITNTPSGAYSPLLYDYGTTTAAGATNHLSGGLAFVGNPSNDCTTIIGVRNAADDLLPPIIALNGTQVFDIGDGAAAVDLRIEPAFADYNATTPGALRKIGAGTLAIVGGGALTDGTSVENGLLVADGSFSSDISVASGASLQAGSLADTGAVAIDGNITLADGARLRVEADATSVALGTVTGDIVASGTVYVDDAFADGIDPGTDRMFLTARSITGNFRASNPRLAISVLNHGTELHIHKVHATILYLR